MEGAVAALFIAKRESGPVEGRRELEAVAGRGVRGDRYYFAAGDDDAAIERPLSERSEEITLFSLDDVETGSAEAGIAIAPGDMRRNVGVRGIDLLTLVGRTVEVGAAVVEVLEDNPPCGHLMRLAGKDFLKPMIRRGGVRGRIVRSGTIRIGDPIRPRIEDHAVR